MNKREVKIRNNFYLSGDGWTSFEITDFVTNKSQESIVSEADFNIPFNKNNINEQDITNAIREYSEVLVIDTYDGVVEIQFHGFINKYKPLPDSINIHVLDPLGNLGKLYYNNGTQYADIYKIGTTSVPVALEKITEDGEIRYVPDHTVAANYYAYVDYPPTVPSAGTDPRRQYQSIGRLRDYNADIDDYPDYIIPIGYYRVGTDLLNYIEFLGYDPTHGGAHPVPDISLDFVTVYIEGTNELEDLAIDLLSVALPDSVGWADTFQFNLSGTYYQKTIWPSLITINEFTWQVEDGSILEMLETLLRDHAPPNYKIWWDHSMMMLRMQYQEKTPHKVTTPYYLEASYAYGGISPDVPPFNSSLVDLLEVPALAYPRDDITFKSKVIIHGVNEWPKNEIKFDALTDLGVTNSRATFIANAKGILLLNDTNAGIYNVPTSPSNLRWQNLWAEFGEPQHLLDFDFETFFGLQWTGSTQPPDGDDWIYKPLFVCDFGTALRIEHIRLWGSDSKRDFKFGVRFEVCDDFNPSGTDLLGASWRPLHSKLYDRQFGPYEEVSEGGSFLVDEYQFCLIWMKCAKTGFTGETTAALTDLEFVAREIVEGIAEIVSTGDPVGTWTQTLGIGTSDGKVTLNMPLLYQQLLEPPAHDSNKTVVSHRGAQYNNKSLINTNACAIEAAYILNETIRDKQQFGTTARLRPNLRMGMTASIYSPLMQTVYTCLIDNLTIEDDWMAKLDMTDYSLAAWTGETPLALTL